MGIPCSGYAGLFDVGLANLYHIALDSCFARSGFLPDSGNSPIPPRDSAPSICRPVAAQFDVDDAHWRVNDAVGVSYSLRPDPFPAIA